MQNKIKVEPEIKVQKTYYIDINIYHLTIQISNKPINLLFSRADFKEKGDFKELDEATKKLIKKLFSLDGVVTIEIKLYIIAIHLAECFSFEKLEPQILSIIKSRFPKKDQSKIKVTEIKPSYKLMVL